MAPGEWISLAGMGGTAVAAFFGLRLVASRNADAAKAFGDRLAGVEKTLANGRFASKELVEAKFDAVDQRLGRIESSLDRIEADGGCQYPNCPAGYERNRDGSSHGGHDARP